MITNLKYQYRYYDGSATIFINGRIVAQGSQFSLNEVEVVTATVDLEEVRVYRSAKSRAMQARETFGYRRFPAGMSLSNDSDEFDAALIPSKELKIRYHLPEEEIAREFNFLLSSCFCCSNNGA
jgi:NAD+ synthase (glutamine-hydrolysing)